MAQRIQGFDERDENNRDDFGFNRDGFDGVDNTLSVDFDRGGGGGGGGGGYVTPIIRGCTDPTSLNYNSKATINDGSCEYKVIPDPSPVTTACTFNLNVNKSDYIVRIDGTIVQEPVRFTNLELLTPKIIQVQKQNFKSSTQYRVSSIKKQQKIENISSGLDIKPFELNPYAITGLGGFGNTAIPDLSGLYNNTRTGPINDTRISYSFRNYYDLKVEKFIDGKFTVISIPEMSSTRGTNLPWFLGELDLPPFPKSVGLDFQLDLVEIEEPLKEVPVFIDADLARAGIITYITSEGKKGEVQGGATKLILSEKDRWIEFLPNGLVEEEWDVRYKLDTEKASTFSLSRKFAVTSGLKFIIIAKRKTIDAPDPIPGKTPIVATKNGDSFRFNVVSDKVLEIYYSSVNSTEVRYSLGKTVRKLDPSGCIKLTKDDFFNSLGNYMIYLQPFSPTDGTGPIIKVPINVFSKEYLPGPDITHINYPQLIRGADFKGFDVNFKISWQSVNTNYIEIYAGKQSKEHAVGRFSNAGAATFNIQEVLSIAGQAITESTDVIQFPLYFIPYNEEGDEKTDGKVEKINITFDKGDLTLRRGVVVNSLRNAWEKHIDLDLFKPEISKFLTHYLHLGGADNKLVATWGVDTETFSEYTEGIDEVTQEPFRKKIKEEKSLVLKLYEPLPRDVQPNETIWISKLQSIPFIQQVTILDEISKECIPLSPNFELDVIDDIGYQLLDDLVASGSTTSTDLVDKFVSGSGFNLENLNFNFVTGSNYNWEEFVKFSSAEERAKNFFYKVETIQFYESKKQTLTTAQPASSSVAVLNEISKIDTSITNLRNGFDSFEKFLYTSSSVSGLTYPGAGQNSLSASNHSTVTSWYNGIVNSANIYDYDNKDVLSKNLPTHIKEDFQNEEFSLFFDMIGQHYDILYTHITGISRAKKLEHKYNSGIANDLIYHMLESLGFNADNGVQSQFLWEFAFGKDKDGSQKRSMSGKDRQQEVWRRILNNLPYLLKHKGTKRSLHALLSCYGVPNSLLTIMEFGGPTDVDSSGTKKFTFEDRTASIAVSGSSSIKIPWNSISSTSDYPNALELRVNSNERQDQRLISSSEWQLNVLHHTGSQAKLQLVVSGSGTNYSAISEAFPYYHDEYVHIAVNKTVTTGGDRFTFFAKDAFQERLRNNIEQSLFVPGVSSWKSGSFIEVGGTTLTGSVDEVRLWTTPLSESRIDNHAFMPDAIDGNHLSSSTEDLVFRLDFEYPKNRHSSGDTAIKNVAINQSYASSATAVNFENVSAYPFQYVSYDRTVTANVPSTGVGFNNKIRFETQTLLSDLNYRSRATSKTYDTSPIDSDRLGLFFSPIKEINLDIMKSLGEFNIDDYIGNPSDDYEYEYKKLNDLRNYYFSRYTLNIHEYIQLVRYIDKSLFSALEALVPARSKVASGLLIEPHILERSKTKWNKPTGEERYFEGSHNIDDDIVVSSTNNQFLAEVSASEEINLTSTTTIIEGVATEGSSSLAGSVSDIESEIDTRTTTELSGVIRRDKNSDEGAFVFPINCATTQSVQGQVFSVDFVQVNNDPDSISNALFGIYAENGHSNITRLDKFGNLVKERAKLFIVKEAFTTQERQNINANDSSLGTQLVDVTKHKFRVTKLPITGSNGNPTSPPAVTGNIVEVTAVDNYSSQHYRSVEDLTGGLENSFFNGSLQTSTTTIDGGSPVQTFTTNPNTLRVSDSGRGSGEPILEVE